MMQDKKGPVAQLKEQFAEKSDACKKLQEEYLRAVADFDNLRRRTERDSEVSRRYALEALVMDLLPVLDNFDRAIQAADTSASAEGLRKGMDLISRQLREALCKHGLQEFSCIGTKFDPRKAEAISFVHTDEQEPGTVVTETCKGYACGERVLRPARVVVAKKTGRSQKLEARSESAERENPEGRGQRPEARSQNEDAEAGEIGEQDGESKD